MTVRTSPLYFIFLSSLKGDSVSGYNWNGEDEDWTANMWRQLIMPMQEYNVPWAFAIGNHDSEGDMTGRQIAEFDSLNTLSLTENGPSSVSGSTNYVVSILGNDTDDTKFNLWFFDSGTSNCVGLPGT